MATDHFKDCEFVNSYMASCYGVDNLLPAEFISRRDFIFEQLEILRALLGKPIVINSGFRCEKLNRLVGGARNSRHMDAYAVDVTCGSKVDNLHMFCVLNNSDIPFHKVIFEKGAQWLHIEFDGSNNRFTFTL